MKVTIEVEGSDTIAVLKQKIQESQKHDVATQKIIYAGKILDNEKTVESFGIKEKDFLVLMVSKPKPTPAPAASSSTPTPAAAPPIAPPAAAAPVAANPPATTTPAPAAVPAAAPASGPAFGDLSSFLSGDALQTTINNMTEMGFPRDQVLRALRASFNNPDRAVEYLMAGIPAHLEAEAAENAPLAQAQAPAGAPAGGQPAAAPAAAPAPAPAGQPQNLFQLAQQQQQQAGGGGGATGNPFGGAPGGQQIDLNQLRNAPQIQQLRDQMIANPESAQLLIQQLAAQNPPLAQLLAQNPEALMQLLGVQLEDYDDEGGQLPPGAQVVQVTEEERAAIERVSYRFSIRLGWNLPADAVYSWRRWDSPDRQCLRRTLRVIRTRS
ncbi:hypothetical protein DXG03_006698 [Asterophora parasitica]|uniref:UV excision repair protein RAD23 n=1 Tax=Asterophora parasitica TaxID=117018 RepID=A0A9P7KDT3_9AGAR|nr:hypothetical protein DXG03_006698 [Asterophora parasitica]